MRTSFGVGPDGAYSKVTRSELEAKTGTCAADPSRDMPRAPNPISGCFVIHTPACPLRSVTDARRPSAQFEIQVTESGSAPGQKSLMGIQVESGRSRMGWAMPWMTSGVASGGSAGDWQDAKAPRAKAKGSVRLKWMRMSVSISETPGNDRALQKVQCEGRWPVIHRSGVPGCWPEGGQ